jgi:hypothetical protein
MSKNNKISGYKNDNIGNDNNGSNELNMKNNTIDNSITKNNNKIIPRNKNAKKKSQNRNILPPQEEPSFENGKFACKLDEIYSSAILNPEINDISFVRPNLELLYKNGIETEMIAYVDAYRKRDGLVVLNNICTENLFLSDHVLVNLDPEEEILNRIGQCIKFKGSVYKYGDKYSINVYDVQDINYMQPRQLSFETVIIENDDIEELFKNLNNKQYRDNLAISLATKLNMISTYLFGAEKFIIGMIFDFYYMRTRNKNLSNNEFNNDLMQSSHRFVAIFSDIIFRLETGLINDFESLRFRVLQLCMLTNPLPTNTKEINDPYTIISVARFCGENNIDIGYVMNNYLKSVYKRYKLKDVKRSINTQIIMKEIENAIINVASRI